MIRVKSFRLYPVRVGRTLIFLKIFDFINISISLMCIQVSLRHLEYYDEL